MEGWLQVSIRAGIEDQVFLTFQWVGADTTIKILTRLCQFSLIKHRIDDVNILEAGGEF